ncbi:MAG TPA: hypothetical protein VL181_05440 [Holophagaceae bacterium]|nr:hypothetical protein [Holophagaceae bacterium]
MIIRAPRIFLGLAAALPLLILGCTKNDGGGDTSGTAIYLYDGETTPQILVWKDLAAASSAATAPGADITLTNSALARSSSLAWGGMAIDTQRNHLYLLYRDGVIIRIDQLRSQSGTIQSNNLVVFTLDSSNRLTGSVFGQLALDPKSDTLYACESGTSGSPRIWTVSQPESIANNGTAAFTTVNDTLSPTGSAGVAAGQNAVYAYFTDGSSVTSGTTTYTGPRLRKGTSSAFDPASVIIGDKTGIDMSSTGTLALDTANSRVYVGLDTGSTSANSTTGGAPVVAFQTGQFGLSPDQAPSFFLGDSTTGPIQALAHPGTKAWLVGLQANGTAGQQTILLWKQPASGVAAQSLALGPSTAQYLGVALDGTGS